MTDRFNSEKRREIMSRVKSRDTSVEKAVRGVLHRMGYRFRLHVNDLPGKPDIVLRKHRRIIFVHGCFWHGHKSCHRATIPKTNMDFWKRKIDGNALRDKKVLRKLRYLNWKVLVLWQCQIRNPHNLEARLTGFFERNTL